jgi:hypothetical protein
MRQVLAVVVVMVVAGCTKPSDVPPVIDPTTVVCTGDVTITSSAEMDAFVARGCTSVTGTLSISGTDLTSVSLPHLRSVGEAGLAPSGDECRSGFSVYQTALRICGNNVLGSIDLPGMTSVHSAVFLDNPALDSLNVPSLATILEPAVMVCGELCYMFGGLSVVETSTDPAGLTSLSLPALASGAIQVSSLSLTSLSLPSLAAGGIQVLGAGVTSLSLPSFASGWVSVSDAGALAALNLPALTTGSLHVSNTALTSLSLPMLTTASGELTISGNTSLTSVSAPELTTVDWLDASDNTALTVLSLPALTSAGVYLGVWNNGGLTSLSLPALASVGGDLDIRDDGALTSLSLPAMISVGGSLKIVGDEALSSVVLPALTTSGATWVNGDTALANISLPALTTVGRLSVSDNTALTTFSLPMLTTDGGPLEIFNNPSLPECVALAFKDHLIAAHGFTGSWYISGNDTTATCPP